MPFGRKRKFERMTLVEAAGHGRQSNGGSSGGGLGVGSGGGGGGEGGAALAPPVCDENAPDLYLPTMAFITYVLCMGLVKGMLKEFHPDVLVMVTSSTLCANFLQVFLLKGALYFLVPDAPVSAVSSVKAHLCGVCACARFALTVLPPTFFLNSPPPPPPTPSPSWTC